MKKERFRILYVIGWPLGQGGHISSNLAFAKYLRRRGHRILVFAFDGPKRAEYEAVCERLIPATGNLAVDIMRLIWITLRYRIQLIQACDYQGLIRCLLLRVVMRRPLVFLKAGGEMGPYDIPPVDRIVVFSEELIKSILRAFPRFETTLSLVKARIDREVFYPIEKHPLPTGRKIKLFMAMRFSTAKEAWFRSVFENIAQAVANRYSFSIQFAGDGPLIEPCMRKAAEINKKGKYEVVSFLGSIDTSDEMVRYIQTIDVMIGHGRGILEGMSCGKPVIIIGKSGEVEWVTECNVTDIAAYNFSGRHFKNGGPGRSLSDLLADVERGTIDLEELGNWGSQFIDREYNVEKGVEMMSTLYEQTCVTSGRWPFLKWMMTKAMTKGCDS